LRGLYLSILSRFLFALSQPYISHFEAIVLIYSEASGSISTIAYFI